MTLRIPAKVLLHVWSYDFYDMTLSTRKQRRHMINTVHEFSRIVFHQQSFVTFRITGCFSGVSVVPGELKMYNYYMYNLAMYCFLLFSSYQKGVFTKHKLYIDL